ncbi:hypothetical protein JW887_01440 [Candidatus Dojkabacteria bacterium]|nr:hypothetical protein [Candidatus Dojkabacteria bacterium]
MTDAASHSKPVDASSPEFGSSFVAKSGETGDTGDTGDTVVDFNESSRLSLTEYVFGAIREDGCFGFTVESGDKLNSETQDLVLANPQVGEVWDALSKYDKKFYIKGSRVIGMLLHPSDVEHNSSETEFDVYCSGVSDIKHEVIAQNSGAEYSSSYEDYVSGGPPRNIKLIKNGVEITIFEIDDLIETYRIGLEDLKNWAKLLPQIVSDLEAFPDSPTNQGQITEVSMLMEAINSFQQPVDPQAHLANGSLFAYESLAMIMSKSTFQPEVTSDLQSKSSKSYELQFVDPIGILCDENVVVKQEPAPNNFHGINVFQSANKTSLQALYLRALSIADKYGDKYKGLKSFKWNSVLPVQTIEYVARSIKQGCELGFEQPYDPRSHNYGWEELALRRLSYSVVYKNFMPDVDIDLINASRPEVKKFKSLEAWFRYNVVKSFCRACAANPNMALRQMVSRFAIMDVIAPGLSLMIAKGESGQKYKECISDSFLHRPDFSRQGQMVIGDYMNRAVRMFDFLVPYREIHVPIKWSYPDGYSRDISSNTSHLIPKSPLSNMSQFVAVIIAASDPSFDPDSPWNQSFINILVDQWPMKSINLEGNRVFLGPKGVNFDPRLDYDTIISAIRDLTKMS